MALFFAISFLFFFVPTAESLGLVATRAVDHEAWQRLQVLGRISDTDDGTLQRTFLSLGSRRAMTTVESWMLRAGLDTWVDEVGNVHGRIEGAGCTGQHVLIFGSHLDTVKDAGKYDGALGIIVGIAALKALVLDSFTEEAPVPCSLQLVAFSDEEGVRFSSTFLGSRALVGTLPYTVIKARDEEGHTFLEVLRHNGFKGTLDSIKTANISDALSSYVEVHIEQGPVLQQRKQFASPVVGISGQTRLLFTVHGTQGHAGTVPMTERKDALAASANIIHTIEKYCRQTVLNASEDTLLVCTVGDVRVWPGSSNVIPSTTNFTVDIRSRSDSVRNAVVEHLIQYAQHVCQARGLIFSFDRTHDAPAVNCDKKILDSLAESILHVTSELIDARTGTDKTISQFWDDTGLINMKDTKPWRALTSGAGHDALAISQTCPIGMLFVRCKDGISHSPLEQSTPEDVAFAGRVLLNFLTSNGAYHSAL